MKKQIVVALLLAGLALALPGRAVVADDEPVIVGEGACTKCVLKDADACQIAITVEKEGKKTTYYVVQNDVTKEFGDALCKEHKKVKATGSVKTVNGRQELMPKKIEVVTTD